MTGTVRRWHSEDSNSSILSFTRSFIHSVDLAGCPVRCSELRASVLGVEGLKAEGFQR